MKKQMNLAIDENLFDQFKITATALGKSQSEIVDDFIRNFIIINKAQVNEYLNKYWGENNK